MRHVLTTLFILWRGNRGSEKPSDQPKPPRPESSGAGRPTNVSLVPNSGLRPAPCAKQALAGTGPVQSALAWPCSLLSQHAPGVSVQILGLECASTPVSSRGQRGCHPWAAPRHTFSVVPTPTRLPCEIHLLACLPQQPERSDMAPLCPQCPGQHLASNICPKLSGE